MIYYRKLSSILLWKMEFKEVIWGEVSLEEDLQTELI